MKNFFKQKNKGFTRTPKFGVTPKGGGFTLVETLVAISIFTMSILGLLVILSKGISDTGYTKKKIVAGYLAQEGIEYIRNMRDTYILYSDSASSGWTSFKAKLIAASCNNLTNGCYFNPDNLFSVFPDPAMPITNDPGRVSFALCGTNCPTFKYNSTTGRYGYTTGEDSGFSRKITMQEVSSGVKVSSTVYWTQASGTYNMVFSENLFNWIED